MNTTASEIACSDCGAKNSNARVICWLCQKPLSLPSGVSSIAQDEVYETVPAQFSMSSIFLITTLIAILCAVFVATPGLGILLAIVATPPVVRTALVVNRIKRTGSLVSPQNKIFLFLSSLGTTIVVSSVSLIVAVGSFCTVCLSAGTESAIPFSLLISTIFTGLVLWGFTRWIRGRWHRDTKRS